MSNFFSSTPNTTAYPIYYADAFATKVNEGSGVSKLIKLARNILMLFKRAMEHIGRTFYLPQISKAISHFDIACKTTLLNKIFSSSTNFKKTLNKSTGLSEKLIYDTLDLTGDILAASGFFGAKIAKASNVTSLINTFIDTKKDLGKVSKNDEAAESRFNFKCSVYKYLSPLTLGMVKHPLFSEENPVELRRIAMLKVVKDIISISTGIIAVVGIATGVSLVSELALLIVSTLSIILGFGINMLEENTSYKVVQLNLKN